MSTRARTLLAEVAVVAVLAVVTIVETFPAYLEIARPSAAFRIHDHFNDVAVIHWNLWWMNEALVHLGQNPFETTMLFHPEGVNLFLTPFVPLFGAASIPLQAIHPGPAGVVWADNLLTVLTFFLCAWFMVRFLRELGVTRVAAVLAALPFAFAPFRFMHFARLHYLSSFWLPLYALCLVRFLDRGGRGSLVGTALIGVASLLSDHHHFIFLVFIAGAWILYRLLRPEVARAVLLRRVLACGLLQIALLVPVALWCVGGVESTSKSDLQSLLHFERTAEGRPTDRHLTLAPDLDNLGYVLFPHVYTALGLRPSAGTARAEASPGAGSMTGLPYRKLHEDTCLINNAPRAWRMPPLALSVVLALVLGLALVRVRRAGKWVWVGLAVVGLVTALGPTRLVFDTPVPMPFRAIAWLIPPLKASRYPAVFVLLALFAAAPLLAFGFQALFARRRLGIPALLVTLALFVLTGASGLHRPLRFEPAKAVPAYEALRDDPTPGAVVELPLSNLLLWRTTMAGQILHGRPTAKGCVVRAAGNARAFLRTDPLIGLLRQPPPPGQPIPDETARRNRAGFRSAGFRYILVHHALYDQPEALARTAAVIRAHRPTHQETFGSVTVFRFE